MQSLFIVCLIYINLEWTNGAICPETFEGHIKFGSQWETVNRSDTCSTNGWCIEATTQTPATIKSPSLFIIECTVIMFILIIGQRDGMIEGQMSVCANNETNKICDQMSMEGLECKAVNKVRYCGYTFMAENNSNLLNKLKLWFFKAICYSKSKNFKK